MDDLALFRTAVTDFLGLRAGYVGPSSPFAGRSRGGRGRSRRCDTAGGLFYGLPADLVGWGTGIVFDGFRKLVRSQGQMTRHLNLPIPDPWLAVSRTILLRSSLLMEKSYGRS